MKVFLFEFITGGGLYATPDWGPPTGSLLREGLAMSNCIAEDFAAIGQVDLTLFQDSRVELPDFGPRVTTMPIGSAIELESQFASAQRTCDLVMIIAPEIDQQLEAFYDRVDDASKILGPNRELVQIASNKLATFQHLHRHGIATPKTLSPIRLDSLPSLGNPIVVKPQAGAGSQQIACFEDETHVPTKLFDDPAWCAQPLVSGTDASVSCLCSPSQRLILPVMHQQIDRERNFSYQGGSTMQDKNLQQRAVHLASCVLDSIPQASGYLGIDLILGSEDDGSSDTVIEINPRLTTSYVGLRQMTDHNLAKAMIDIHAGQPVTISFEQTNLRFQSDGSFRIRMAPKR